MCHNFKMLIILEPYVSYNLTTMLLFNRVNSNLFSLIA
nr:MAG TPA: hypothetical protein [Caudoviricetes sp.]